MKRSAKCPKCKGTKIEPMSYLSPVALDFGTYYLGDRVIPTLYVCLGCGYCETWIKSKDDLSDINKYAASKKEAESKKS